MLVQCFQVGIQHRVQLLFEGKAKYGTACWALLVFGYFAGSFFSLVDTSIIRLTKNRGLAFTSSNTFDTQTDNTDHGNNHAPKEPHRNHNGRPANLEPHLPFTNL